jgi:ribosome-associated protein
LIKITDDLTIPDADLSYDFIRASGPGGQNVNKVSTAIQLRFNMAAADYLSVETRDRLAKIAPGYLTSNGELIIEARRYRTQEANRQDAEQRLAALIQKALLRPKKRRPTRPSAASSARRVEAKKHRGSIKRNRQSAPDSE